MINRHKTRGFDLYCHVCGKLLKPEENVSSYRGFRCGNGMFGNTIWVHMNKCMEELTRYFMRDKYIFEEEKDQKLNNKGEINNVEERSSV